MTDLLHTIPDFPIKSYTHLLPSLEKHLITTTDLLTLDALEIAKRAHLPLLDVRRLAAHVVAILQRQLGLTPGGDHDGIEGSLKKLGNEIVGQWSTISTLDDSLDEALDGGIPTGYITEITGERCQLYVLHSSPLAIALWTDTLCLTFQWRRQNPAPTYPPPFLPTPSSPWPRAPNHIHIHRTPSPHKPAHANPQKPSPPIQTLLAALAIPNSHPFNARPRIPRPYPDLPTARRAGAP